MKILYLSLLLIFSVNLLPAQMYERAVGVRLGYSTGIFFDQQNSDLSNYRFIMSWRDNGRHLTAMKYYRKYKMGNIPQYLSFYYGYGLHAGFVKWNQQTNDPDYGYYMERKTAPVFGIDALIGVSYDFTKLPISLTCDIKPFFDLWGRNAFTAAPYDFAIGAVY